MAKTTPFSLHQVWDEAQRTYFWAIRHGRTPQARSRYPLHAVATVNAWNARRGITRRYVWNFRKSRTELAGA